MPKSHNSILLLIDGSVDADCQRGYGASLALTRDEMDLPSDLLTERIEIHKFEQTSSTKLELQTLLKALETLPKDSAQVTIFTDSQNIIGLPGRRARLEQADYFSKKQVRLANYHLYQEFYRAIDQVGFQLVKVQGHQPSYQKGPIERLFTLVDRASRSAARAARSNTY